MTDTTTIKIGSELVSGSGVDITITDIEVQFINRPVPRVFVTYEYDDNGRTGIETVSLGNFCENLAR